MNILTDVTKRGFDLTAALIGLTLTSPIFLGVGLAVRLGSKGPAFYKQIRVGRNGEKFYLYKFRTMVVDADRVSRLTPSSDSRITKVGLFLRKSNLDELPQLLNVVKGDMSLVGPRPEVPDFVDDKDSLWKEILKVRPGMTNKETLVYRREGEILASHDDFERAYREIILPEKMKIAREYAQSHNFWGDVKIIMATIYDIVRPGSYSKRREEKE